MQSAISLMRTGGLRLRSMEAEAEPAMTEFSHLYGSADKDKEKL
jgi:hypothetical protein